MSKTGPPCYVTALNMAEIEDCAETQSLVGLEKYGGSYDVCRICHEDDKEKCLMSPCKCTGSLAKVHFECLRQWLITSQSTACELCGYKYHVHVKPKKFIQFLRNPGPPPVKRTLYGDITCLIIVTPLACVAGWLCIWGATGDHKSGSRQVQSIGLVCLTMALFVIYLVWAVLSLRYHLHLWNEWMKSNVHMDIVITPNPCINCDHGNNINNGSDTSACSPLPCTKSVKNRDHVFVETSPETQPHSIMLVSSTVL